MVKVDLVIPVAGKGTRSGLNYPKSLYCIGRQSILVNLINKLKFLKSEPIIIVSSKKKKIFFNHLKKQNIKSNFVLQKKIIGMGEAINCYVKSKSFQLNNHTLLVWGDLLYVEQKNILKLINNHVKYKNTFSFLSGFQKKPYTLVSRDKNNKIKEVSETLELKKKINYGERDIGIFIFNNKKCKKYFLNKNVFKKGKLTKETKFLSAIKYLVDNNERVQAYPYARSKEMLSFNSFNDIKKFKKLFKLK